MAGGVILYVSFRLHDPATAEAVWHPSQQPMAKKSRCHDPGGRFVKRSWQRLETVLAFHFGEMSAPVGSKLQRIRSVGQMPERHRLYSPVADVSLRADPPGVGWLRPGEDHRMNVLFAFLNGWEILVLAVILLLVGAKHLPALARELGEGMREFKKASEEEKLKND